MRETGINQGSTEVRWKTLKGFKQGSDNWVYTVHIEEWIGAGKEYL